MSTKLWLEQIARVAEVLVTDVTAQNLGFVVLVFEFEDRRSQAHVANGGLNDTVDALLALLDKLKCQIVDSWNDEDRVRLAARLRLLGADIGWPVPARSST